MKAFVYNNKPPKGNLHLRDLDTPLPRAGEVLVEVRAVSVNAADYRSMKLGIIPQGGVFGADIAGRVAAVGPGGSSFQVGDNVVCDNSGDNFGGFAEYATVKEGVLARMPAGLSPETCAAVPLSAVTALQGLRKYGGDLRGKAVLINGAAGGVGSFAVQLAKFFGADVTGVCGSANVERVKALGADRAIDYTEAPLASLASRKDYPARYDLILGVHGNYGLGTYRNLLAPRGRYVMVGGELPQVLRSLLLGPLYSFGNKKFLSLAARPSADDLKFVLSLAADGAVSPLIERVYPFEGIPEAVRRAAGGHAWGKLVISVKKAT